MAGIGCQSLWLQWQELVKGEPHAPAVRDAAGGQLWSRADLDAAADGLPASPGPRAVSGRGISFLAEVIRGFRDGVPVVLQDQAAPLAPGLNSLSHEIGLVKSTSGSTGQPRFVLCTAAQLSADADAIVSTMGLRRGWPNIGVLSMAHSYGFSNLVLPLLLHGIPLVIVDSPLPAALERAVRLSGPCTVAAVPAMWRAWHAARVISGEISLAVSAGAPLPLGLEQAIHADCRLKVHNFYGSSECGGIAYDTSPLPRTDAALAGTPMQGVSLSTDTDGLLVVRSAAVASGYLIPDGALRGGIFRTADVADLSGGCVRLLGRASDAISVAGRKIAPAEIEAALLQISGVKHCVVFGVPSEDAIRGEEIVACVNLGDGVPLASVQRAAGTLLPAGNLPRHWSERSDLGPDARGKIPRAVWRGRWLNPAARSE